MIAQSTVTSRSRAARGEPLDGRRREAVAVVDAARQVPVDGGFDEIIVDAYRQPYIPFYLATREFFELVQDRLAPGGQVIVNVGHPEDNDELEKVLGRTMAAVFGSVLRDPVEEENALLIASDAPTSVTRLRAARLNPELRSLQLIDAAAGRASSAGRIGLHRRQGAGRMADRQGDPRVRSEVTREAASAAGAGPSSRSRG